MKSGVYLLGILGILTLSNCEDDDLVPGEPRLQYYVESFDVSGLGFEPQLKVTYAYTTTGKVKKYTVLSFDPDANAMVEQRHFTFSYLGDKVDQIDGYLPGQSDPYIKYAYEYMSDDKVSKIRERNNAAGVNSEASFTYGENGVIQVAYVFSNGGFFQYEFDYATGNIVSDRTMRGAQLCSNGQYTYDQHKNPFKNLGYVDYLLTNLSTNNKLTENVTYAGCAFPTLVPESYTYEYNDKGYPTSATTVYKSGGSVAKSKREFYYGSK